MCGREEEGAGVPPVSGYEAYQIVANELDVAPELRKAALDGLETWLVTEARAYAKRAHQKWPPAPRGSGWRVTVSSW